jgi:uncharacterized protein (DUF433 family)
MIEAATHIGRTTRLTREWLSLLEAVVLAEVPEKRVRKDIETGLFPSRRVMHISRRVCFRWTDVFALAAVYGSSHLNGRMRKLVLDKIERMDCWSSVDFDRWCAASHGSVKPIYIDSCFFIDANRICDSVGPRVTLYANGLDRVEENEGVLGGETVFKHTRISVRHIGTIFRKGENVRDILEDYPALTENDINFADLYARAHPITGRPRARGGVADVLGAG